MCGRIQIHLYTQLTPISINTQFISLHLVSQHLWVQNDWQFVWKWELFKDMLVGVNVTRLMLLVCTDLRTQGVYGWCWEHCWVQHHALTLFWCFTKRCRTVSQGSVSPITCSSVFCLLCLWCEPKQDMTPTCAHDTWHSFMMHDIDIWHYTTYMRYPWQ